MWYMSLYVGDRLVCTCTQDGHLYRVTYTTVIFTQLILQMMDTGVLETCRELEYVRKKRIVRQVGYLQV
jgi:hypothetical protein